MPGPIDALKSYFSSGSGTPDSPYGGWQKTAQGLVEGGTQGLLGMIGLGDDSSQANRGGQLLSAALPLAAPHPAISALLKQLSGAPEAINADRLATTEKLGGWIPHRTAIVPPDGFELPAETSAFTGRDPNLIDRYVQEQSRFNQPFKAAQISPYGTMPSRSRVPPAPKANFNMPSGGYESKFSLAGAGVDDDFMNMYRNKSGRKPK